MQGPSWSSFNYGGAWKLLHHRAARFFAPLLVSASLDRAAGTVTAHITSDICANIQGKTFEPSSSSGLSETREEGRMGVWSIIYAQSATYSHGVEFCEQAL